VSELIPHREFAGLGDKVRDKVAHASLVLGPATYFVTRTSTCRRPAYWFRDGKISKWQPFETHAAALKETGLGE
jgi:hypothetical protein